MSAQDTAPPELEPVPKGRNAVANTPDSVAPEFTQASVSAGAAEKPAPFVALRHRDFRLIWSGSFVSQVGSYMQTFAVPWQLYDLTHNPVLMGLTGVFRLVPVLLLSLFGGIVADALDRRRLLILTQSILGATSLVMAAATLVGWMSPWLIYGLTSVAGVALAFDNPARSALIPNLVPRAHLANALSLSIIVSQAAWMVGPMIAGLFLGLHSLGYVIIYAIDAVSFIAVVISLLLIRTPAQKAATRDVSFRAAIEGFRFLRRTPIILSTMTLDFFATFFGAATVLIPLFTEQVLHAPREASGLLVASQALGAVVAATIMSLKGSVGRQGMVVIISVAAYGACTMVFGLSSMFWLTALALAGTEAADTVSMVMRQTIRQLSTPDELRGRMTSVNMIFYMGGPQLGQLEAGVAASLLGLSASVALGGIAVIGVAAVIAALVPALRAYDRGDVLVSSP